eukprot:3613838-Rhodomonas_salina.3
MGVLQKNVFRHNIRPYSHRYDPQSSFYRISEGHRPPVRQHEAKHDAVKETAQGKKESPRVIPPAERQPDDLVPHSEEYCPYGDVVEGVLQRRIRACADSGHADHAGIYNHPFVVLAVPIKSRHERCREVEHECHTHGSESCYLFVCDKCGGHRLCHPRSKHSHAYVHKPPVQDAWADVRGGHLSLLRVGFLCSRP